MVLTSEIQSLFSAGGMGEVYRVTDAKLGRDVQASQASTRMKRIGMDQNRPLALIDWCDRTHTHYTTDTTLFVGPHGSQKLGPI
jgi:hypothetical protein